MCTFERMKTLTVNLPETIDVSEKELKTLLASVLYENGKLSLGQAAELAGYSKATFMELLGDFGISLFNYDEKDLEKDILNAKNYHI